MSQRRWLPVSVAIIGVAAGLAIGLRGLPPSHGDLHISSVPAGASIFLDHEFVGVTPQALRRLARGIHLVRLSQAGYVAVVRTVAVEKRRSAEHFELVPLPATGTLVIHSEPSGAHTWLDGVNGPLTPGRIEAVLPGRHEVRVEKAGWDPLTESVEVAAGREAAVQVKLTPTQVAYYLDAIKREPDNSTHYVELGRIYVRNGELDQAFDLLMTVMDSYSRQGRPMDKGFGELLRAMMAAAPDLQGERWQRLSARLMAAIRQREPDDHFATAAYDFLSRLERWDDVHELADHYLEHGRSPLLYHRWRLAAAAKLGREQQTAATFKAMLAMVAAAPARYLFDPQLHLLLRELRRWREISQLCDVYLQHRPGPVSLLCWRMEASGELGDWPRFDQDYQVVLETLRKRDVGRLYANYLRPVLFRFRKWEQMAEVCESRLRLTPESLPARYWHLEALCRTGKWQRASQVFDALTQDGLVAFGAKNPVPQHSCSLVACLWAGAWAKMELGQSGPLEALLRTYEADLLSHYWVPAIRGEAWRRRPQGAPPKPWLEVKPCAERPVVDGSLDDEAWQQAGRSSEFLDMYTQEPNREQTTMLATYDRTHLYIGIIGHAENRLSRRPPALDQMPNRRFELYLDANLDYETYRQFMFDAYGLRRVFKCTKSLFEDRIVFDPAWQPVYELETRRPAADHTLELAIPYAALDAEPARPGAVWGFNLIHLGSRPTAFVPLGANYHRPGRFGFLVFR